MHGPKAGSKHSKSQRCVNVIEKKKPIQQREKKTKNSIAEKETKMNRRKKKKRGEKKRGKERGRSITGWPAKRGKKERRMNLRSLRRFFFCFPGNGPFGVLSIAASLLRPVVLPSVFPSVRLSSRPWVLPSVYPSVSDGHLFVYSFWQEFGDRRIVKLSTVASVKKLTKWRAVFWKQDGNRYHIHMFFSESPFLVVWPQYLVYSVPNSIIRFLFSQLPFNIGCLVSLVLVTKSIFKGSRFKHWRNLFFSTGLKLIGSFSYSCGQCYRKKQFYKTYSYSTYYYSVFRKQLAILPVSWRMLL